MKCYIKYLKRNYNKLHNILQYLMSHRISIKRAKMLREKELELQVMQRENKFIPVSRRHKKYLLQYKKQTSFIKRLKDRIKNTGGILPEHLQEKKA